MRDGGRGMYVRRFNAIYEGDIGTLTPLEHRIPTPNQFTLKNVSPHPQPQGTENSPGPETEVVISPSSTYTPEK